jgi:hypothetical protein
MGAQAPQLLSRNVFAAYGFHNERKTRIIFLPKKLFQVEIFPML